MFRKLLFFVTIIVIGISSAIAGGFITPNDIPEGFVAYVRANAGQFLVKGDVIFVKEGLNPKIDGFVLSDDTEKIKEMISGSTDPNLSPVNHRQAGLVAYGWGSGFSYNASLNKITTPKSGGGGNGSGGGNSDGPGHGGA